MAMGSHVSDYFSTGYAEARRKFREVARAVGGEAVAHHQTGTGPDDATADGAGLPRADQREPLSTDMAWFGPAGARRLLLAQSGTHGVEGFCGSGIQIGWLCTGLHRKLPADTAMLLVHAINPHGFAWQRRVNEDNIDLNRNFVAHGGGYPVNSGYEQLRDSICPREWTPEARAAADETLRAYGQRHGAMALQGAITSGQYIHAEGVFYGGNRASWSQRTLSAILQRFAGKVQEVGFIDLHTGLGPLGYGEIISNHEGDSPALARVRDWFGDEATTTGDGTSSAATIQGDINNGVIAAVPQANVTGVTLEYGTVPLEQTLNAVRADNWLHIHGRLVSDQARDIKAEIRTAFYPETDEWKRLVFQRSVDVLQRTLAGLARRPVS
jgi:predicted deacylase